MRTISLRCPDKLVTDLEKLSETLDRSKSYVIQKALESYISEQADYEIAIARFRDSSDKVISLADMRKKLSV